MSISLFVILYLVGVVVSFALSFIVDRMLEENPILRVSIKFIFYRSLLSWLTVATTIIILINEKRGR